MSARDEIKGAMSRYIRALGWDRQEAESMASLGLDAVLALPLPDCLALAREMVKAEGFVVARDVAHFHEAGEFLIADNEHMRRAMLAARMSGWNACRAAMIKSAEETGE